MAMPNGPDLAGLRFLVTDGDQRAALAIVRSLGAARAVPVVCSGTGASLAGASRFAATELQAPDSLKQPEAFVQALQEAVRDHAIDCLLPVTESSLRAVLRSREQFDGVLLPFPPHDTFVAASDKRHVMELATRLGIPVPHQVVLQGPGSVVLDPPNPGGTIRFPLVLKPSVSVAEGAAGSVKLSVVHVANRAELERAVAELPAAAFPILAQERVTGPGVGVFLLRWNGRILARFAHRRLREKPPSGGVSVYRESIAPPPDALAHAEALLEALDWQGVAMVEFKCDERAGTPYLMEINGRFWGSLQLAIDAGVDFPRLLVEAALGKLPGRPVEGRPGVRLRWLLGDLDHLLLRLRKSRAELALGTDAPGRLRALGSFLLPWRPGERWEVLRPGDPRPFGREVRGWVAGAVAKGE